ncbi:MAG: hypothetical protein U0791_00855 [Gemmataceae bacterium]
MVSIQNVNSDSMDILLFSAMMVLLVGSIVFTFVGGLTFVVFRDK